MADLQAQKDELALIARRLWSGMAQARRRVRLWFAIGGTLLAGIASVAVNFVDPQYKPLAWALQGLGFILVFLGSVILDYFDESAPEAISRAHVVIRVAEERETVITSLSADFKWLTTLYTIRSVLRDIVQSVLTSGPGSADEQQDRLVTMLDVLVADHSTLCETGGDRWNFAIYLYDGTMLNCAACRRPTKAEEEAPIDRGGRGKGM